jgi:hypothetical protein
VISVQLLHPVADHSLEGLTDWEEYGSDGLRPLCFNVARILKQRPRRQVQVLQLEGCDRGVASAGEHDQGDDRPVATLDRRLRRHGLHDAADLLQGRRRPLA